MVLDPTRSLIHKEDFPIQDWSHTTYSEFKEPVPPNAPEARVSGFVITVYVDADHAGDTITRKSRTGFIIFLNSAPIYWTSKKQNGIETSSFESEFQALKHCCEYLRGLRYNLRMMGIYVDGASFIYGDNKSVLVN